MKNPIILGLTATIFFLASCGLRENEKKELLKAQQVKDDSIRLVDIQEIKHKDYLRKTLTDTLAVYNGLLDRQQKALIQLRANIFTANDEMNEIRQFHLGRTPQVREEQVHDQELKIQQLALQQTNLLNSIQETKANLSLAHSQLGDLIVTSSATSQK